MLELLQTPLTVLHIVVCFFLVLVVLIQPGKSGGLGAAFGGAGATQVFGGRGAGNFLSRTTWICAGLFFVTSMTLAYISSSTDDTLSRRTKEAEVHAVDLPAQDKTDKAGAAASEAANEAPALAAPAGEPAAVDSAAVGESTPEAAPADPAKAPAAASAP